MLHTADLQYVFSRYAVVQAAQVQPLGAAGGMSGALFWRLDTPQGAFILRRWPSEHPLAERLRFIHAVLRHAYRNGCRIVPVPIDDRSGASIVEQGGNLWELSPWLPGAANFNDAPNSAKLNSALAALARFHTAAASFPLEEFLPGGPAANAAVKRLSRLRELGGSGVPRLEQSINNSTWPELAPLAHEFVALLPRAVPQVLAIVEPLAGLTMLLQPCIRDIWHDHVLFTGDAVTGIIDFGALEVDTPATDVARLLGSLVGDDPAGWQAGLAAYTAVRPLSPVEAQAVTALHASGTLLAGCNWIRWIYIDSRQFENSQQVLTRFAQLVERTRTIVARHSLS